VLLKIFSKLKQNSRDDDTQEGGHAATLESLTVQRAKGSSVVKIPNWHAVFLPMASLPVNFCRFAGLPNTRPTRLHFSNF
jgi:hypothetical protein